MPFFRSRHPLLFLIVAALLVRIVCLLLQGPSEIDQDGANFARTAENLHAGLGYVGMRGSLNLVHSPLYPMLIAALMVFGGSAEHIGLFISLWAGALLVVPIFALGQMLYGRRTAILAACVVAVHPFLIAMSAQVLADGLTILLSFTGIAALVRSFARPWMAVVAGSSFGLAFLARPEGFWQGILALLIVGASALLRRDGLRASGIRLAGIAVPLALFTVPYIVFLSGATGHARIEAKSAVNYALGTRMAAGMRYEEAADGLGPNLREDGPELGAGFYVTHHAIADPSLKERLQLAAGSFLPQMRAVLRTLVSRPFGTPLFPMLAVFGLLRGPWNAKRQAAEAVLLAFVALDLAALCSLHHLWPRYVMPLLPFLALWAGKGLGDIYDATRERNRSLVLAGGALLVLLSLGFAGIFVRHEAIAPVAMRSAASYIASSSTGNAPLVMSVTMLVPFYAGATAQPLPYSSSQTALAYITAKRPQYLVLESTTVDGRPYLRDWLANGIPDARARRVFAASTAREGDIIVYRWVPRS